MPGLVAFRRRWSIGSDDLIAPAVGLAFLNGVWILAVTALLIQIRVNEGSTATCNSTNYQWYPIVTIVILFILLLSHISIAVHSGRGGVFDTEARAHLPYYCYIRSALLVLEVAWSCAGCVLLSWKLNTNQCSSSDQIYMLMCAVVGTNMVVIFLTVVTMYVCFDPAGRTFRKLQDLKKNSDATNETTDENVSGKLRTKYEQKWMSRVKTGFCCSANAKPNDAAVFQDIALLLASYLHHLDVVLSDFIAGMILLRKQQRALFSETINQPTNDIYQYLSGMPISPRTKFLTLKDDNTQSEFSCMTHFAEYAVASYGWQGQYFFYPGRACCSINVCGRCRGCPSRNNNITLLGDNCCQCQYTAISRGSPLLCEDDFIYGNYQNESHVPSYYVCLDHKYKRVLLCIRGTMSISDAVIDLHCDCEEISVNPKQPTWQAHMGMISAATNVYRELADNHVLESAFTRCPTSGYKLLVVGHSLGAGVASVIAFLLREQYPQLYCYAYSPPGGLLSPDAMEESKKFTTSVVVGKDMIPRLGLAQLEYFRSDVLSLLENCSIPKWRILSSTLPLLKLCINIQSEASLPRARSQNYNPFASRALSSTHSHTYLPGRVLHIVKNYPKEGHSKTPLYQAVWSDNASFDTIIVSPSMIEDHMPDSVLYAMQQVLVNHGPKKPDKMLSEEERQAILQLDDDAENATDIHSSGTDLSWEYTCQMEADAVAKTGESRAVVSHLLTPNGMDTPSQWLPAPLASQEDLLSIRHSTPSLASSRKGLSDAPQAAPPRSQSLSECIRTQAANDGRGESFTKSSPDVDNSSTIVEDDILELNTMDGVRSLSEREMKLPNFLVLNSNSDTSIDTEDHYFAHIGGGNQHGHSGYNGSIQVGLFGIGGYEYTGDPPHHSGPNDALQESPTSPSDDKDQTSAFH